MAQLSWNPLQAVEERTTVATTPNICLANCLCFKKRYVHARKDKQKHSPSSVVDLGRTAILLFAKGNKPYHIRMVDPGMDPTSSVYTAQQLESLPDVFWNFGHLEQKDLQYSQGWAPALRKLASPKRWLIHRAIRPSPEAIRICRQCPFRYSIRELNL